MDELDWKIKRVSYQWAKWKRSQGILITAEDRAQTEDYLQWVVRYLERHGVERELLR